MLTQILQLLVVAWLPGAVIFRLPLAQREKRAALDAEERLFWAVIISLCVSLAVVLLLAFAGRYRFARLVGIDLGIAAVAAAAGRFRLRLPSARRVSATALLPLALACLGMMRFFPPSEYVIGGKDPGVYMNEGIQIAQRGRFVVNDPVVASVPPFARDLFFPSRRRPEYYSVRFMGYFVRNPDAGTVVGQFPHLFPASIAMGYGLDGLTGARRTVGCCWAILGVLAAYFAGARVFGRAAAFAAATLLTLHVITTWFARYPNAEVVMMALLGAAVLASSRAHVEGDPFFGPVAGGLVGLLLFLRFDAVLGIAGVCGGIALASVAGRRMRASFAISLAAVAGLAFLYLTGPMRAYVELPLVFVNTLRTWHYAAVAALMAAGVLLLVRGPRLAANTQLARWVPLAISILLTVAAIYALYFREPRGKLAAHDAYALRTFTSLYLSLPALAAALLGYALWARRAFWKAPELFTTAALFSLFFFYKIRIVPDHFWMARRFLPVILPAALLFACGAALLPREGGLVRRAAARGIGLTFLLLLAFHYERASRPLLGHVEYAGVIPKLEELAGRIEARDLLLVEGRDAGTDLHTLALPLAYIYDKPVLVLNSPVPDKATFAAFLDWARMAYNRVLFMGGGGTDLLSDQWSARVLVTERFQVPEYDEPGPDYPRGPRPKQFDFTVFELTAPADGMRHLPDIDIGSHDDLNVLRFHAKEQTDGRLFRWSRPVSFVMLPPIDAGSRTLTIWMSNGGRPPAAEPADVTVSLNDTELGRVRVADGFRPYEFALPSGLAEEIAERDAPVRLRLDTVPWVPQQVLGTSDDRPLGVMVDRVTIR